MLRGLFLLVLCVSAVASAQPRVLKVGVTAGPHAQILEVVARVAAKEGLTVKIIEFSDYVQPNEALAAGELDANSFQHQPYLDQQNKDRGYRIVSIARTVTFPIGVYSRKHTSLRQLPKGARVALPNDPTNGGRVLKLLEREKLIQLRKGVGIDASVVDVEANPKQLKFIELDAAQLPRALDDVDAAAINTNYALEAGLSPLKDALVREAAASPYANVLAVRDSQRSRPEFQVLVRAYHSSEVKRFIDETFRGAVVTAW
ncbi:Methionine ABC transporter substrate-binding protein [Cystobacter fuscus DSM 2262]|uniref:Methionine ABC transporter substrate-binding protein n=1 Tax=Cystobacter fuscus (strain ATCC 25194 / DSM 2262 / NBRC 100088 / M29) TaxID=1242864 RepID=S9NZ49_CYSF2|nr:MetQ/NlpA family ABC transporter substrate-binding protein [Cystobacter fuscus]EPX56111.1 Methionine ABC transporter substrate-binding protein [Cystobacter fuscus DSM 2262]